LQRALRIAAALALVWTLLATHGMWSAGASLKATTIRLAARRQQMRETLAGLEEKRRSAARAGVLRTDAPDGWGSAVFTGELATMAREAGARLIDARVGAGGGASAAPAAGAAATQGATEAGWTQAPFECSVVGSFGATARFLDRLAKAPRLLDLTSASVSREGGGDATAGAAEGRSQLQLRLAGTLHGLPDAPPPPRQTTPQSEPGRRP